MEGVPPGRVFFQGPAEGRSCNDKQNRPCPCPQWASSLVFEHFSTPEGQQSRTVQPLRRSEAVQLGIGACCSGLGAGLNAQQMLSRSPSRSGDHHGPILKMRWLRSLPKGTQLFQGQAEGGPEAPEHKPTPHGFPSQRAPPPAVNAPSERPGGAAGLRACLLLGCPWQEGPPVSGTSISWAQATSFLAPRTYWERRGAVVPALRPPGGSATVLTSLHSRASRSSQLRAQA